MKKVLFFIACLFVVSGLQAQTIKNGDKFWDGSVLYTAIVGYNQRTVELEGVDANSNNYRISLLWSDDSKAYSVSSRDGAIALRISETAKVQYIRQEGMYFLAFYNAKNDVAWTMTLTPDNLKDCIGQERWAEQQPVSDLLTGMLMNTKYLARFSKPDLRLMRNEILARHGWRFQSKDLRDYFGRQSWYKPVANNNTIKLNIIEQTNIQLMKSEEATPDEYRTSMLNISDFPGGLADDGRGQDEINGDQIFTVNTEREFLAALGSNRTIVIAKDVHLNLSRVLENEKLFSRVAGRRWTVDASAFIGQEPLVISESEFDGQQLALVNFSGLVIKGAGNSSIEVDPRYSYCLYFINCDHCEVHNLTIGHTEGGYCSGGVIGVRGGRQNMVKDSDLYGCGTYGFDLYETQDFSAMSSLIHDCTYGIMQVRSSMAIRFSSCDFFNNKEYTLIESFGSKGLSFSDCRFFANYGDSPLFHIDTEAYMTGCEIYHPTENLGTMNMFDMSDMKFSPNPYDNNISKRNIGPDVYEQ